jgi:hypothetical protein
MTHRRQPRREYDGDRGYPSLGEDALARRGFLERALAGASVAAGALVGAQAWAAPRAGVRPTPPPSRPTREKVSVQLDRWRTITGSNYRFQSVDLYTWDPALARFLKEENDRGRLREVAMAPLAAATAAMLESGKLIYALERKVGERLAQHYRVRTKRSAAVPDVMLYVTQSYGYHTAGVMVRPSSLHTP